MIPHTIDFNRIQHTYVTCELAIRNNELCSCFFIDICFAVAAATMAFSNNDRIYSLRRV